ncbi:thiamine pyrophosphate-binding protein [Jannaschia seohaensis]|uniref:Acetolactate synthase-1/2/3 large subunit n=1 Tax=Jannaschia seohaensis TaxID=475081 RepID=A0A2Y9AJL0_9RHOB|nr:thiamine pyrophosphate-binding protein [Jannaschia seohaensis]PWJ20598.1 acetolactate synthase-1/2/3 large subunit [Jannaschia seohaensis]SSA44694.1 acetolactate synthase-1/2/3 large subunit [Jannaschia seohaensis]
MATEQTLAEVLIGALHARGTQRIYGVPGGGSSLDLIAAAEALGMTFVLTRTENAAVMMAAADADLTGAPGAVLTTKGPGLAQAMNGIAHAALDRAPVVVITDGFSEALARYVTHQVFDQKAMSAPVVKGYSRLESDDPAGEIAALIDTAQAGVQGPVHIELTGAAARRVVPVAARPSSPEDSAALPDLSQAHALLAQAKRPVVVVGLEARGEAPETLAFVESLGCPVLTTYKAKGIIPDDHPARVGLFTGGAAEAPTIDQADLIVLVGLDPVELILQPWRYEVPVLDIAKNRHRPHYVEATAELHGPLAPVLTALAGRNASGGWSMDEIAALREGQRAKIGFPGSTGITAQTIVEQAAEAFGPEARITVDAGAHMLSATAFWPAMRPNDVQISNGLASMAFALPAGIAAALAEPGTRALAFTGDGGLKMCIGELATAVQYEADVTVIVFNDGALTMIDLKQQSRGLAPAGVRWPRTDFAAVARGFGCAAWRVSTVEEYNAALAAARETKGPSLIDVVLDPKGYAAQLKAMRG